MGREAFATGRGADVVLDSEPANGIKHDLRHSAHRFARAAATCAAHRDACAGHANSESSDSDAYAHRGCSTVAPATAYLLTTQ